MKSKLAVIFDSFLLASILSVLFCFWMMRLSKNAFLNIYCSIIVLFLMFFINFKILIKKYNLEKITVSEQKQAKDLFLKIKFMPSDEYENFIETLLSAKIVQRNIYKNSEAFFYVSLQVPLSESDFIAAHNFFINQNKALPLVFVCQTYLPSFFELLSTSPFSYDLFVEQDIFVLMKEKNYFPKLENEIKQNRLKVIKSKLSSSVTKSHFKEFFFSGLSLIVISLVIPFSTYYLIFGSFLLILSAVCIFTKNQTKTKPQKNLSSLIKDVTKK